MTKNLFVETGLRGANHGFVTTTDGIVLIDEQGAFIREWVDYVRRAAVATLTAMTDRYPMDVGQDGMAPMVMKLNAANLHDYATGSGIHQRS